MGVILTMKPEQIFIAHVRKTLKKHKGRLLLLNKKSCDDVGIPCAGYLSQKPFTIKVAKLHKEPFLEVLVHENAHLTCFLLNTPTVRKYNRMGVDIDDIINNPKNYDREALIIFDLEREAEKYAINSIKKFNLPIDIEKYTRRANF